MKNSSIRFLSKANTKRNKKSNAVIVLICLLTIACTVISSFTITTENAVKQYKSDYKARAIELEPWSAPITDETISAIKNLDHVESVDDTTGLRGVCRFDITDIDGESLQPNEIDRQIKEKDSFVYVCGLIGDEKKTIVAGESLEDSPVFSCIVPSLFYPFEADNPNYENLDYIDGTKLIGKTLTVKGFNDEIDITYNYMNSSGSGNTDAVYPSPEFQLKIVGTYFCSRATSGAFWDIFVSRETDLLMTQMTLENAGVDLSSGESDIAKWWNDSTLHSYFVVSDDYGSLTDIYNKVSEMGYSIGNLPEFSLSDSTVLMANLFGSVGRIFIAFVFILAVIILIQSSASAVNGRKSDIGLLKTLGYKDRQIFACLCYEQLSLTLKGFCIGGILSAAITAMTNFIFRHKSYQELLYIIDWKLFVVCLCVSMAISVIAPLICQILLLKRMTKIQPREAM